MSRFFRQPKGLRLEGDEVWCIHPSKDFRSFITNLDLILTQGSVLYLEGTGIAKEVMEAFATRECKLKAPIAKGTIWPRPEIFHIPMNRENLNLISSLFDKFLAPEICDHFHAYFEERVVLEWHDAFYEDPCYVSTSVDEEKIIRFCRAIDGRYYKMKWRPYNY